jgi:RHS repeat-associated protein
MDKDVGRADSSLFSTPPRSWRGRAAMRRLNTSRVSLLLVVSILLVAQSATFAHAAKPSPSPPPAPSCTHLSGGTYSSNATWTTAQSPYVLDGSVSVAAGATLTIQPGVVVKLNGAFRTLNVNGTVNAVGTSANRITFTSIQDDSIGGDCGGDGPTTGAPGQWYFISVDSGNANSTFDYVDVRYGGNGSTNIQYGALRASGTSTSITVDHANITDNQRAGILLGNGCASCPSGVTIKNSLLARNGAGISAVNGWAIVGAGNTIRDNAGYGLFFNLTSGYTGLQSTVTRSDIAQNGGNGVQLYVESGLPTALWPSGNRNNIYANRGNSEQLGTLFRNRDVDWTGNFWGTDVSYRYNAAACQTVLLASRGRLTHADGTRVISGGTYIADEPPGGPFDYCDFDDINIEPWEFSPTYLDGAGDLPPNQILGGGGGLHANNPAGFNAEPVNTATGNYYTSVTDLRLPGIGVPFAFTRSYNSLDAASGPLGPGWTHSYAAGLTIKPNGDVVFRAEDGQQVEYTRQGDGTFLGAAGTLSALTQVTGGYELLRKDQVRYAFDTSGLLTSIRDRNGQGLSFAYVGGKLSTITDSAGRAITLFYNAEGLLSQVALPDGRSVGYGYTGGRLAAVTDARNGVTNYTYEAHGWLKTIVDQNTHTVVTNTYGNDGRVIEQLDARGKRSTFDWNAATRTSTMTDARQNLWKDVYTKYALTKRINPLGNTTEYGYDGQYNLTSVKDPRGNITTMTYDPPGNMRSRTPPASLGYAPERWTYTALNDVDLYTDRKGNITDLDYDPAGNLTAITQPGAIITQFETYPGTGLVKSITDPRLKKTSFEYDAAGNLKKITTPLGNVTTMDYDSSGRMTSLVEPRGNVEGGDPAQYRWTYTYDNADQLLTQTDPLGNQTTRTYDAAGNLQSRKDAKLRTTSYGYDAANHLTSVTAPDTTIVTSYEYDDVGNLIRRIDPKTHVTRYDYNAANRLTSVVSATQQQWTYEYDPAGNVTKMIDAAGNATPTTGDGTTIYGYDVLNRLMSINYSDATPDVTYAYDANSNRTSMTDGAGTETYTYDSINRLKSVNRSRNSFLYEYDAASNLTKRTYPDNTVVDYTYDGDERLETVMTGTALTRYAYDEARNLIRTTLPSTNGYVESRAYDRAGRLTEVKNEKGANVLSRFTYTLDEVGNPTTVATADGTISYTYDALDRLTEACFAASCPAASDPYMRYDYDAVGNRKTETRPSGTTTYTYNDSDQLTSQTGPGGTVSYTYDDNGNLKSAGARMFTYDLANRLRTTTLGSTTFTYTYDGDGKRLQAYSGTQTANKTNYLWDPNGFLPLLVRESDGKDVLRRRYVYGADLISMTTGAGPFYYHHDGLGSVANLTSAAGTPQWTYTYEPFGSLKSEVNNDPTAPTNLVRFTGELIDTPTMLYHLRARQFDPSTGRFLSLDPAAPTPFAPYVSPYAYVNDRPTVFTDPSGRCFIFCAVVGAVVGAVTYGVRVAVDDNIGFSLKGLAVYTAAGAVTGFTAGAASFLELGYVGTATLSGVTGVGTSVVTAGVCDAPLPGAADLGVELLTGGIFGAFDLAQSKVLAGTDLAEPFLPGTDATPIELANISADVEANTFTSSIGASCK